MNSGSYIYQKGDLVSIKQDVIMLSCVEDVKVFNTTKKLENGIFLGVAKEDDSAKEIYEYCIKCTPIRNPCIIAIGGKTFYVDQSNFFFYNRRKK